MKMTNRKFAVFILSHGRAKEMVSANALKKGNYTGEYFIVIDDEDDEAEEYRKKYGDKVIQFHKQKYVDMADTMDNMEEHRAGVYARNAIKDIALEKGLTHYLMLDDDLPLFMFRYVKDNKLKAKAVNDLNKLFEIVLDFLDESGACMVALCQNGDFIGGKDNKTLEKGLLRKVMNTFFCKCSDLIEWKGTFNDDMIAFITYGSRGKLFFSIVKCVVQQLATQSLKGGATEVYLKYGTYTKSFYPLMACPSAVKIAAMQTAHSRIHQNISYGKVAPMILHERWKKRGDNNG